MQIVAPETIGISAERLGNIQTRLRQYVDNGKVAGFVTLVARESDVAHFEACGFRDAENRLPMERGTIFRIYSMTKPITSIALMQLYERGKFHLAETVSRYIPQFGRTKVLRRARLPGPTARAAEPADDDPSPASRIPPV